jgi:hypothetical protein
LDLNAEIYFRKCGHWAKKQTNKQNKTTKQKQNKTKPYFAKIEEKKRCWNRIQSAQCPGYRMLAYPMFLA